MRWPRGGVSRARVAHSLMNVWGPPSSALALLVADLLVLLAPVVLLAVVLVGVVLPGVVLLVSHAVVEDVVFVAFLGELVDERLMLLAPVVVLSVVVLVAVALLSFVSPSIVLLAVVMLAPLTGGKAELMLSVGLFLVLDVPLPGVQLIPLADVTGELLLSVVLLPVVLRAPLAVVR